MDTKPRLVGQLNGVRNLSEKILSAFTTPEQWVYQVHPQANHALWFAGHIGLVDDFLVSAIAAEKPQQPEGYKEKFGMGSRPTSRPADYPAAETVLAFWRERREALLKVLAGLSEDDLARPKPVGLPELFTDVASMFELATRHEAMHAGQVTVARRALGHEPLRGG